MAQNALGILVLLREVTDPRPPAQLSEEGALIRDRGLRRIPNPADLAALEEALAQAAGFPGAAVTALAVGPPRVDDLLRWAVAMGAHRAIRIWDDHQALEGADASADAALLERCLEIFRPDLWITGSRLLDRGDAPGPALACARAGLPHVDAAAGLRISDGGIRVTRRADRGARQELELPLPAGVFVEAGIRRPRYPDMERVLAALEAEIEVWGLPDLGLPAAAVGEAAARLARLGYRFPRPDPLRVPTPDPRWPAPQRTAALLSGGIQPRAGRIRFGTAAEVVDALLEIFTQEGLLPAGGAP
ncbi:electron transfer flavoprotein subunit beta/FixA family protein [Deferrisoma sp.]